MTKNTAYTLSAPTVAHTTGYTWTVNGITGTDNGQTYTFTPTGGEDITATVALTVDAGHKLTINKTGNGTVTVAKMAEVHLLQKLTVHTQFILMKATL